MSNEFQWIFVGFRSPQDSRLFIVIDEPPRSESAEPVSAFDQLNLFDDNSNDMFKRAVTIIRLFIRVILSFREDKILVV